MKLNLITLLFYSVLVLNPVNLFSQSKKHFWNFEKTPVWSDEFDTGSIPDSSKWTFETGGDGWGNNELQYYTDRDNVKIESGLLKITAKKENRNNRKYTSSRLITKNKGGWKYGRIEIRAKMPAGRGLWPAFWMLPQNFKSFSGVSKGEIDILEYVGYEPDIVHFSLHTKANNSLLGNEITKSKKAAKADKYFHIYRMDWASYGIRGYIDGKKYFEYLNNGKGKKYWPFNEIFFLIINLAVGGDWGGYKGVDNSIFPATLEIDYVRVYEFLK